jgi:putative PIG3 family NAD(P)H quinone oxidoreductase
MAAVEIAAPGPPDVLRPVRRPVPRPGPAEVLIKVEAAGVNRPDLLQRAGHYPPPPGASDIPGLEVAGTVVEAGPGAAPWAAGDAVTALVAGGGYAEYCVAPAAQCLPIPRGLDRAEAAALPETVFTVWTNVFERGRLQAGEALLVHGGSSGIGTTAIQMARAFGARVFVTAGTPEKCAACVALGAERAIDYNRENFVAAVNEATGARGVDVVLDMVGAPYFARNLDCLAPEGRLVQIGVQRGPKAELNLLLVMHKRLTVTGSTLRPRSVEEKGRLAAALREKVWPKIEAGAIRPVIHALLPLAEAREAHRVMEASGHIGKLVLVM